MNKIILTGGAGFIGSHLAKLLIKKNFQVHTIDCLTYAANYNSIKNLEPSDNFSFSKVNICDYDKIENIFFEFQPDAVFHLAAESHVDNSILNPGLFIQTNIIGTYNLLRASMKYCDKHNYYENFKFLHVSTDEVYGSLSNNEPIFTEDCKYKPNSPYSASKASSDHLVRAWQKTYGLPVLITNCSNNYGSFQHPEKFIPLIISNALKFEKIPIYGDGLQIRDWLHVSDHVQALYKVLLEGKIGEVYNIGSWNEIKNIDLAKKICKKMDELLPINDLNIKNYSELLHFVEDRKGHDERYAIDSSKIFNQLKWKAKVNFDEGLSSTITWYMNNLDWCNFFKRS